MKAHSASVRPSLTSLFSWGSVPGSPAEVRAFLQRRISIYLLFTSGSTGRPKGVQVPHRAVAAMLAWVTTQYEPRELESTGGAAGRLDFVAGIGQLLDQQIAHRRVVLDDQDLGRRHGKPDRRLSRPPGGGVTRL